MGFTVKDNSKELKMLETSYIMYEKTISDTVRRLRDELNSDGSRKFDDDEINKRVELLRNSQSERIERYLQLGGSMEYLQSLMEKPEKKLVDIDLFSEDFDMPEEKKVKKTVVEAEDIYYDGDRSVSSKETYFEKIAEMEDTSTEKFIPSKSEMISDTNFDLVSLPSKGECYRNKMSKISVSYLNAFDENIITAPNLYRDNAVIDTILRRKIVDESIDSDNLLEGDRDAIVLFLRATGFGTEYPITATDNKTGIQFDTVIDLSKLNFKKFTLKGDENGYFDYTLPVSRKNIKFKFLTHKDIMKLERADEIENDYIMKGKLEEMCDLVGEYLDNDKKLSGKEKLDLRNSLKAIEKWKENIAEGGYSNYSHMFTNALDLSVVSVDGVYDRKYIRDFVRNMPIKDSSSLKKYISENEPGIDYNIEIEKPESLGGGSMKVFLQIDQYLFLDVPE